MGVLQRFTDIMASNINALLDRAEDPEKMIDQTLRNLREDLAEVKKETANVIANEKSAKRKYDDAAEEVEKYTKAATKAVEAGNDGDARTLLTKKQQLSVTLGEYEKTYNMARENSEKMRQMHDKLVNDIQALEDRRDMIKAKVATAKAREHMNKMVSGTQDSAASIEAFNRMEAKADKMLDAAEAMSELNETPKDSAADLAEKYSSSSDAEVDAELAAIKASLGK